MHAVSAEGKVNTGVCETASVTALSIPSILMAGTDSSVDICILTVKEILDASKPHVFARQVYRSKALLVVAIESCPEDVRCRVLDCATRKLATK